jgi:hypothetical protein
MASTEVGADWVPAARSLLWMGLSRSAIQSFKTLVQKVAEDPGALMEAAAVAASGSGPVPD